MNIIPLFSENTLTHYFISSSLGATHSSVAALNFLLLTLKLSTTEFGINYNIDSPTIGSKCALFLFNPYLINLPDIKL